MSELELLPVFVEVVRQGSFTRAAAQLGVPKSTVSRRIARLERSLGVELIGRTTRAVRLTDAGADLYRDVVPTLERLEEATRGLAERQRVPRGVLRVTMPADLGDGFLASAIGGFVARYPEVRVEVAATNRVVDLIGEGFDVALRAGKVADTTNLVAHKIGAARLGLFAASSYLERRGIPERVEELADHDCVLFRAAGGKDRWTLDGPDGEARVDVRGPVTGDDFTFVRSAVLAGLGIGLLPLASGGRSELRAVLPAYTRAGGVVCVVYPSVRHLPAKTAAFRDHVVEHFRGVSWLGC